MASDLPPVFKALSLEKFNLLSTKGLDDLIATLRPRWVDYEANGKIFKSTDKSKAIVYCDNVPAIIPAVGLVDGENSQLGEYGNLWIPRGGRTFAPELNDLQKARFILCITYPRGETKVPKNLVDKTSNQVLALNKIQSGLNAQLAADTALAPVSENNITDWINFEESDGGVYGCIKATLGNVYSTAARKLKGKDVKELSPRKSTEAPMRPKCDSLGFFNPGGVPKAHTLQPVEELPIFLADGSSAKARDADDLSTLLYPGRWIRVDLQMVIWNIKNAKGTSRAFKLEVVKVALLPPVAAALNPNVTFMKPNSLTETDGNVPQDLVDAAENGSGAKEGNHDKSAVNSDSEDTVSDRDVDHKDVTGKKRGPPETDISEQPPAKKGKD